MPVKSDSGGIDTDDLEEESADQGVGEALCLLGGSDGPVGTVMQSTNGEGGCSGGGEGQLLLDDIVSAERDDEEYAEKPGSDSEGNQFSSVLSGRIREQSERIHGRDCGNE